MWLLGGVGVVARALLLYVVSIAMEMLSVFWTF